MDLFLIYGPTNTSGMANTVDIVLHIPDKHVVPSRRT